MTWNIGSLAAGASASVQLVLQAASTYTGANPSIHTVIMSGTGLAPATDAFNVAVTQTGQVCSTYYFRNATTNVGTVSGGSVARS